MTVSSTVTLPNQPTDGLVEFVPLGGDGYLAPLAQYIVSEFKVDGDVSGGSSQLFLNMDPQYQGLVQLISFRMDGATADVDMVCSITTKNLGFSDTWSGVLLDKTIAGITNVRGSYAPAPLFDFGQVNCVVPNVDGDDLTLGLIINCFARDASRKVPMGILLSSLPRGATFNS